MKYDKVIFPDLTEEEMEKVKADMVSGNIPAMVMIVMHNQAVLNEKLNKLIKRKEK